ncbi:MAG: hypothetical protein ACRC7O_14015, partial [Fimbriiglobus sp.]
MPVAIPPKKWEARPDPASNTVTYPPGLAQVFFGAPMLAALDGPFAINKSAPKSDGPPRSAVIDLRSGKRIGEYPTDAVRCDGAVLGPDGAWLVGPNPDRNAGMMNRELLAWKLGSPEPAARLKCGDGATWFGFVGPTRVAVLTYEYLLSSTPNLPPVWRDYANSITRPQDHYPLLRVFDLTDPASFRDTPLSPFSFRANGNGRALVPERFTFSPVPLSGAVSPGGRYVAVAAGGYALVDVIDGKVVSDFGVQPGYAQPEEYAGVSFSPDGSELFFARRPPPYQQTILPVGVSSFSMVDGQKRFDVSLTNPALHGRPMPGPTPDTMIIPYGITQSGRSCGAVV